MKQKNFVLLLIHKKSLSEQKRKRISLCAIAQHNLFCYNDAVNKRNCFEEKLAMGKEETGC